MNGASSPGRPVDSGTEDAHNTGAVNGHHNPAAVPEAAAEAADGSHVRLVRKEHVQSVLAEQPEKTAQPGYSTCDAGAESEAETLIDSPVKKREAERAQPKAGVVKIEKPAKSRIGSLPVPGEDDEDSESLATPVQSIDMSEMRASSEDADEILDDAPGSDQLDSDSGMRNSPHSIASQGVSTGSSRAFSQRPDNARNGADSPNPRKRKHRASSVSLPRKRKSMDPATRALRGMNSEGNATRPERSWSPRRDHHRRAGSTHSALMDGAVEGGNVDRKRRPITQFPVRDPKPDKPGSDASSEWTSLSQLEAGRPKRGVGRSTHTPGRHLGGREHKRYVDKYGFTRLAEACANDDLEAVKEWREKDPDQLEVAEFAGNTPLQIAALSGNEEVVRYLIDQGCRIDCANVDKDTPLIDAAENGHLEVVRILLRHGVDPLRQNLKGQQALDVVTNHTDDADEIRAALREAIEAWNSDDVKQRREEDEELRHRAGPSKELHFMARTYENLLRLVTINDRNGVREFLDARVPVDNVIIAAAAKTGDQYLVNMLLAEMTEQKAYQKAEKPVMAVLGTSHFEMVKMLTELDQFNPLFKSRTGNSWPEIAADRAGPHWQQEKELLQRLYDVRSKSRTSSSPVTKRAHAKRRPPKHEDDSDDDDDEESAPRRRGNRRRLLMRKAMPTTGGKEHNDSDSEGGSTSDTNAAEPEASATPIIKAPESPTQKRSPERPRTKTMSPQGAGAESSPKARRRSSSLRGPQDPALPMIPEKAEENDAHQKDQGAEAKLEVEEAQRLVAKRKEDEAVMAEVKRVEEEQRMAEEERKAKSGAEAHRREAEQRERKAEEERKRGEERRRREMEMDGARRNYHRDVLAALPAPLAQVLDDYEVREGHLREQLLKLCTPVLIVAEDDEQWLLNVQAAPLLGSRGLELLLPPQPLGFGRTFCAGWQVRGDLGGAARKRAEHVVHQLAVASHAIDSPDEPLSGHATFEEQLRRTSARLYAIEAMEKKLLDGTIKLELVRLQEVLANLDPLLQASPIEVQMLGRSRAAREAEASLYKREIHRFTARLAEFWNWAPLTRTYIGTQEQRDSMRARVGKTEAVVVHEK